MCAAKLKEFRLLDNGGDYLKTGQGVFLVLRHWNACACLYLADKLCLETLPIFTTKNYTKKKKLTCQCGQASLGDLSGVARAMLTALSIKFYILISIYFNIFCLVFIIKCLILTTNETMANRMGNSHRFYSVKLSFVNR